MKKNRKDFYDNDESLADDDTKIIDIIIEFDKYILVKMKLL